MQTTVDSLKVSDDGAIHYVKLFFWTLSIVQVLLKPQRFGSPGLRLAQPGGPTV
jgi:hypothetical protein